MPRHPPCALINLATKKLNLNCFVNFHLQDARVHYAVLKLRARFEQLVDLILVGISFNSARSLNRSTPVTISRRKCQVLLCRSEGSYLQDPTTCLINLISLDRSTQQAAVLVTSDTQTNQVNIPSMSPRVLRMKTIEAWTACAAKCSLERR